MRNKYIFNVTFVICIFNLITAYSDTIKISSEKLNVNRDSNISIFPEMLTQRMTQLNYGRTKYQSFTMSQTKAYTKLLPKIISK